MDVAELHSRRAGGDVTVWLFFCGRDHRHPAPRQPLAQRLHQTRARHKTRLRPGHMQRPARSRRAQFA